MGGVNQVVGNITSVGIRIFSIAGRSGFVGGLCRGFEQPLLAKLGQCLLHRLKTLIKGGGRLRRLRSLAEELIEIRQHIAKVLYPPYKGERTRGGTDERLIPRGPTRRLMRKQSGRGSSGDCGFKPQVFEPKSNVFLRLITYSAHSRPPWTHS